MPESVKVKNIGLRGVVVADTAISFIDGEKGVLIYRGYRIEDLATHSSFPETAFLLLYGYLPEPGELAAFDKELVSSRQLPDFIYQCLREFPRSTHPMDALQATVPLLAMADPESADDSREANLRKALRLISRVPVVVAAWHRIRKGLEPLSSKDHLSHAANFLWSLHGQDPDPEVARDLDICLVLHADHTFNASTFACREVVSTRAHMYAGIAAGVGALSGPLHGGANAAVMEMLQDLEGEPDIADWVRKRLERKERIMGLGHAVYKTMDPRAKVLKEMAYRLGEKTGQIKWAERTTEIERAALAALEKKGKTDIRPNVDFYSASVYHMMGIPGDLMTCIFAISRIAGWCAHVIEEKFGEVQGKPMLYRPKAEYVGDYCGLMGCTYQPPTERS